jgi:glycosyltransferase involved in cell wall biosynthesis
MNCNNIKISIIVASHRPGLLNGLLDALSVQTFDKASFEVIIVTDYDSSDLQKRYDWVNWSFCADISISAKRNAGVVLSRGDIIAFTDDDCIPALTWLENGLSYLSDHQECSAVEGFTTIEKSDLFTGLHKEYRRLEKPGFRTNNIFYRRTVFQNAGGFDKRFTVQREDVDLAFTVIEKGGLIGYSKDIMVMHRFRHWEPWDLLKNCWNRRFDPLLKQKHPELYRKHIGSPVSPSIKLLFTAYVLLLFSVLFRRGTILMLITHFVVVTVLSVRRTGVYRFSTTRFFS